MGTETEADWDDSTVSLRVPVARLGDALPLMADVALRPDFPDKDRWWEIAARYGVTTNVIDGPMASLPTYVFANLGVGSENSVARAWAGSTVLLSLIFILFITARLIGGRNKKAR